MAKGGYRGGMPMGGMNQMQMMKQAQKMQQDFLKMQQELESTRFEFTSGGGAVKAVILAAAGPVFSAGHDLKELTARRADADRGRAYFTDILGRCSAMMQQITALPQPVIAEVLGIATAAGCHLVASCDMAVAAEGTRFGVNGVNIGLFCSTPMVALTRNLPRKQAFELLTTGDFIPASRARELGLVNRVVPPEALTAETLALAQALAAKLSAAVKIGKRAFYDQIGLPLDAA